MLGPQEAVTALQHGLDGGSGTKTKNTYRLFGRVIAIASSLNGLTI